MKMSKTGCYILMLFLLTGCFQDGPERMNNSEPVTEIPEHLRDIENLTVYPANPEPAYSVEFERDIVFENREVLWIGPMFSFTVDDLNRVYVSGNQTIHVFDSDGEYLTVLARSGEGPGELNNTSVIRPRVHSNQLFVYDGSLQRINVYALDSLEFDFTIPVNRQKWSHIEELSGTYASESDYYLQDHETILMGFLEPMSPFGEESDRTARYYQLNREGEIVSDKIFEHREVYMFPGIGIPPPFNPMSPFTRSTLTAVSGDGNIISAWTDEFLINIYSSEGQHLHSFYYPIEQSDINDEKVIDDIVSRYNPEFQAQMLQNLREIEFPETWPLLAYMLVDDENRFWVATITDDEENYKWWILNEEGELLARFDWSGQKSIRHLERREIQVIKNGYLYTRETDEQNVASIVRYRIVMEENEPGNE